jgi:CheY-like chemotaxis protein
MERNESALLVDSDMDRARSLQSLCESAGLSCQICEDGESALSAIQAARGASILLTQLTVPKADAFEVIAQFRSRFPSGSGARVIALSSFADLRDTAMAHRDALGIDHILNNQVPAEILKRILRSAATQEPADAPAIAAADSADLQREREVQRRQVIEQKGLNRLPLRPPDEELQKFVQEVAARCQTPIALMTLAVDDRLIFPARYGIDATEIDRYSSLCGKVIEAGEPLFVPDATLNPAFHSNALVQAGVIRGYASAPVCVASGLAVGTLCLINSSEAMRLGAEQVRSLRSAAVSLGSLLDEKRAEEERAG